MRDLMHQVAEFHFVGRARIGAEPEIPSSAPGEAERVRLVAEIIHRQAAYLAQFGTSSLSLRARLMIEELAETLKAAASGDVVEVADGLADLAYVTAGTAIEWGIPLTEVSDEVHRSNMAKFVTCESCDGVGYTGEFPCEDCGGIGRTRHVDKTGKIGKPPGWTPPDIESILFPGR